MSNLGLYIRGIIIGFILVVLQILIFNNIQFSRFVNIYIYVAIILSLPFGFNRATLMTIAFFVGLIIDIFCNTIGMHAFSCVLIAFAREYILRLLAMSHEYRPELSPDLRLYGPAWYFRYAIMMILLHHISLFFIEQFDVFYLPSTLLRILLSSIATLIIILILQIFVPANTDPTER